MGDAFCPRSWRELKRKKINAPETTLAINLCDSCLISQPALPCPLPRVAVHQARWSSSTKRQLIFVSKPLWSSQGGQKGYGMEAERGVMMAALASAGLLWKRSAKLTEEKRRRHDCKWHKQTEV